MSEQINIDRITILLADDEEIARTFAKDLLTMKGYGVIEAIDGEDAVRKFMEYKDEIRLLLFDIAMPKKSGIDAYKEIREFSPDVDCIFVSGNTFGLESYHLTKNGTSALIQKPYLPKQLFSVLNDVLGHKKSVSGHLFQ